MATKPKDIIARIKDNDIEWVDLRFTDPKGKWQHLTMCAGVIDEDALEDGLMFDGSSIEGWKAINESDMILMPDLEAVYDDPFSATPMLVIFCDIVEPSTGEGYARDPRTTAKRAEFRFPDAMANPYLCYSALLMAGLDGIQNKIHPGDAMDKNLYDLPPEELSEVPTVCGSLREALDSLLADHDFLLKGDVFSKDQIEAYVELKWDEVYRFEQTPSPVEFDMYYSA